MTVTREELATKIDSTDWFTLRAHLERGALIVVDTMLDLAETGAAVAADEVAVVERWIASGMLAKPSAAQIRAWEEDRGKRFNCLIVSPYVLFQEITTPSG